MSAAALGTQAVPTGPPPPAAPAARSGSPAATPTSQANGPAAITVNGNQSVGNITFDGTGYTLNTSTSGAGTLTLGGATPTITTNAPSATINSILMGTNGLTKAGTGTLTLTNTNTYTGGTTVNNGTLTLGNGSNTLGWGIVKGDLTINSGATVFLNGIWDLGYLSNQYVSSIEINNGTLNMYDGGSPNTITMSGGTIEGGGSGFRWYHGGSSQTLTPTLYTQASSTPAVISVPIQLRLNATTGTLNFNVAQGTVPSGIDLLVSGQISQNEGGNIVKTDAGVLCFSANNTYTGTTYVNAGTLQIGNGGAGEGLASHCLSVSGGAVLAFNNADTLTISPSAGVIDNGLVAMNGAGTLTISPSAGISGNGAVVVNGAGTLVLGSTNNAYTGGTTVNNGLLVFSNTGAIPTSGTLVINSGGASASAAPIQPPAVGSRTGPSAERRRAFWR